MRKRLRKVISTIEGLSVFHCMYRRNVPLVSRHCRTVQEPWAPQNVPRSKRFVSSAAVLCRMPTEHFKARVDAFTVNLKIFKTMEDGTRISAPSRWRCQIIDELSRSQTHMESWNPESSFWWETERQWKLHPFNLTSAGAYCMFFLWHFGDFSPKTLSVGEPCVCSML